MENAKQAPFVTLVAPEKDAKGFSRGERIILVNGERWGRTIVSFHGMHGTSYTFEDEGGPIELPYERPNRYGKKTYAVTVRIGGKRRQETQDQRPTEEQVRSKAQELVDKGLLRDPAVVKVEHQKASRDYREQQERANVERRREWSDKVRGSIGSDALNDFDVLKVVELMEWAQSQ